MTEEIFGPYRLDGLLGRGGMGEVHRAYDTRKGSRAVALKLLPEQLSTDAQFRARFRREAEIVATLSEPHVIPIHDYGEIDGRLYLDMRIVDGDDLATVLRRGGPLSPERTVGIVEQVAAALDAAHANKLIHRDVKPSNVLVCPGPPEFVYLVDFGIARLTSPAAGTLTAAGAPLGTLNYMAPEQFRAEPLDRRVDVYALSCLLYETLTGHAPYTGAAPALMHSHLTLPPPTLAEHRPGLPSGLDEVIGRGMAKQRDDRYASAGALSAAARAVVARAPTLVAAPLGSALDEATLRLRRPPSTPRPPSNPRRPSSIPPGAPRVAPPQPVRRSGAPPPSAGTGAEPARPGRRRAWLVATGVLAALAVAAAVVFGEMRSAPSVERVLTGHTDWVHAVATARLDDRPVVVSGADDQTVRVWDVTSGAAVGAPVRGHADNVRAVATAELDGRPVMISAGLDRTVRVWDLGTGAAVGQPLVGHTNTVAALTTAQLNGRPVIISGSHDTSIRVWDLATGTAVGQPLVGHTSYVHAVATAQLDGRPVIVSGSYGEIRVWDLATGTPVGQPITGHTGYVNAVAVGELAGRPVVVSGGDDDTVRIWDLATHAAVGAPLDGHTENVDAVAVGRLGAQPVIVSGGSDNTVRIWDMATGKPLGQPITGHSSHVYAVATTELAGRPVIVSASADGTIRIWDLRSRADR